MMRTLNSSSYSLIAIIILMLAVMALSLKMAYFSSKLLPLVIAGMVLFLALIDLARELKKKPDAAAKTTEKVGRYTQYLAWIFGFFLAIYVAGFMIAIPLFVGAYMKRHGSGWPATVITAFIYTGIIYAGFELALKTDLYKGKLLMWIGL